MEELIAFSKTFQIEDGDTFSKFSQQNLNHLQRWLATQFEHRTVKNNATSTKHRQTGNNYFLAKDLEKSLDCYTKSLCFAVVDSKEFGLALANRSAVFFEMKEYWNCLKDIELCITSAYPAELKPKVFIRKCECYSMLNQAEKLQECIKEVFEFLQDTNLPDKEKYKLKLQSVKLVQKNASIVHKFEELVEIPKLDCENENFAYASKKIKLSKEKGRHVVAATYLERGDILFIEKAFVFARIFESDKRVKTFKCCHCLCDILSSVPCHECTVNVYCDDTCRNSDWSRCHQWECNGMQAHLWFHMGVAYPALKAFIEGARCGFRTVVGSLEDDVKNFGNKEENYGYFSKLSSSFDKENVTLFVVLASVTVLYLQKYTDFFDWLSKRGIEKSKNFLRDTLCTHIAQMACNSSTIDHWLPPASNSLFPKDGATVACGIFPSYSMMNHSCKPNVTIFFVRDTIIVKALEDTPKNQEICNCYGIDFRVSPKLERQITLKKLYGFSCKCVICSDPSKELDLLDSYICKSCKAAVPEDFGSIVICQECGNETNLKEYREMNRQADKELKDRTHNRLALSLKALNIKEKILNKYHRDLKKLYHSLFMFYTTTGDVENMYKYFQLCLEIEKVRRGENSKVVGMRMYETPCAILYCLQKGAKKPKNLKRILEDVDNMMKESRIILNLYFPENIINKLTDKVNVMVKK